jgi:sporulation protein YlmC with PRC-barrel domain
LSSNPDQPVSSSNSKRDATSNFHKREEMLGRLVIGTDAVIVGKIKDLAISTDGRVALQVERNPDSTNDSSDLFVGSEEIQAVSDVVLLKHPAHRAGLAQFGRVDQSDGSISSMGVTAVAGTPSAQVSGTKTCSRCGYDNSVKSRFCVKCGNSF